MYQQQSLNMEQILQTAENASRTCWLTNQHRRNNQS
jgi:hypothetical protein